jgi:hypothetical protein
MAATAEELSSQAETLQSAIAFFKTDDSQQASPPPTRKAVRMRSAAGSAKPANPRSTTTGLSHMDRAIRGHGATIDLDANSGGVDARDREFAVYPL